LRKKVTYKIRKTFTQINIITKIYTVKKGDWFSKNLGNLIGKVPQYPGELLILPKTIWALHDAYPTLKT